VVDEYDERSGLLGDPLDGAAQLLGLLVGKTRSRFVEQHDARSADDGAGDLDEASLAGTERADLPVGIALQPDERDGRHHVLTPIPPCATGVFVEDQHVLEHREARNGLLRSGTFGAVPSEAGGSRSWPAGPRHRP
jgi:hypothetical protein